MIIVPARQSVGPEPVFLNVYGAQELFQGMNSASLCGLAGRYNNPIPTRSLAPIECLKISALYDKSVPSYTDYSKFPALPT
jgi:hypothetical protein